MFWTMGYIKQTNKANKMSCPYILTYIPTLIITLWIQEIKNVLVLLVSLAECVCCYLKREILPLLNPKIWVTTNKWNEYKVMSETLTSRINFYLFCVLRCHHKFHVPRSCLTSSPAVCLGWVCSLMDWNTAQGPQSRDWCQIRHQKGLWVSQVGFKSWDGGMGTWGSRSPGVGTGGICRQETPITSLAMLYHWLTQYY